MNKKSTLLFLSLLFGLYSFQVFSQDTLRIDTTDFTICGGSTINLSAVITGSSYNLITNNFNNNSIGTSWSYTAANPVFNNPCGPGPNSWHAWVGTTPSQQRTLITNSFDFSNATQVTVKFWMRYGLVQSSGNCEDPDASNEGVHLQWSTNNGTSWTDFPGPNQEPIGNLNTSPPFTTSSPGSGGYWAPYSSQTQQQQSELYYWNKYECQVPLSAMTSSVKFRWAQLSSSNAGFDAWGIDEVEFEIIGSVNPNNLLWTGNQSGSQASYFLPEMANAYDTTIVLSLPSDSTLADTITVTVLPQPKAGFAQNADSTCTTIPVSFTNDFPQLPGYSYSWYVDGNTITNNNYTLDTSFSQGGYHIIELAVSNGYCTTITTDSLFVKSGFQMPNFTAYPQMGCAPLPVDFEVFSSNYDVYWQLTPQVYSSQNKITYNFTQVGIFHPELTVTDNVTGCQASATLEVKVASELNADFVVNPQNLTLYNSTANFTDQTVVNDSLQSILNWSWDFDDGNTSNLQNPSHTYTAIGNYNPSLAILSSYGCADTATISISVVNNIEKMQQKGISIYPNPADEFITIESDNQLPEQIRIFDASGKLIEKIRISEDKQQRINISHLSAGIYFLDIRVEKEILRFKIIKG